MWTHDILSQLTNILFCENPSEVESAPLTSMAKLISFVLDSLNQETL